MMDAMAAMSTAEERVRKYREYVEALEEERRKIQVFQRELPLSVHLVTQTIENCRQQMAAELLAAGASAGPSELDEEEVSSEGGPVLEEFIPIKRSYSPEAEEEEEDRRPHHRPVEDDDEKSSNGDQHDEDCYSSSKTKQGDDSKKPDWLRSVQLWSQQPDPQPSPMEEDDDAPRRPILVEAKRPRGAFQPFNPQRRSPSLAAGPTEAAPLTTAAAPSLPPTSPPSETRVAENCCTRVADEKDGHTHRKTRRCWTPELHKRFLDALQRLGGSHVATPKQIRDLMKVDGLTNDEVKSHLQKYRLHSRRPSPASRSSAANPSPPQQVVFVGGIWVPPPEYAAAAAVAAAPAVHPPGEGIVDSLVYAPIASVPTPPHQQAKQGQRSPSGPFASAGRGSRDDEQRSADDDDDSRSNSPATSSSSHTTSTSPPPRGTAHRIHES